MFDSKLTWVSYIYKLVWFPESFLEFPTDFIFGKSSEELCFLHKMKSKDGSTPLLLKSYFFGWYNVWTYLLIYDFHISLFLNNYL